MPSPLRLLTYSLFAAALIVAGCGNEPLTQPEPDDATSLAAIGADREVTLAEWEDFLALPDGEKCFDFPRVVPPDWCILGRTSERWSAAWWRWLWSVPAATNPGLDTTGEFVDENQHGLVWFLAPNYGGVDHRTATIPWGRFLFIDVAGFFGSTVTGDGATVQEIRDVLAPLTDGISGIVFEVDGEPIDITTEYRVQSVPFSYYLPPGHMFELFGYSVEPGVYYPGVADAYHVMLWPLRRGDHTIHIYADLGPGWGTSEVFFNLTVN